jgi:transcriptional regulator GlxA family with amidase domain
MSAHLSTQIAIAQIARVCRLSLSHFVRAFSNTVGIAPYQWFLRERVALAKHLLRQSRLPLAEIALECGFVDQSHFTNTFVRHVGLTPGRWRRSSHPRPSPGADIDALPAISRPDRILPAQPHENHDC